MTIHRRSILALLAATVLGACHPSQPWHATDVSGTVKWFNPEKGFGFVTAEDGGKDVFVHISVLERSGLKTLAEGERVAMRVVQGQKGREALSVNTAA